MPSNPIVLVHGSYHQPAHYDELAGRLAELGSSVTVPDSPEAAARAVELLRPDTPLNFTLSPIAAEWKNTPSLYVATRRDRTWPPTLATKFAQRCTNVVSIDTGHSPFLSAPDVVVEIIRDC